MKKILEWLLKGMTVCTIALFILAIFTDTSYKSTGQLNEANVVSTYQNGNGDWIYTIDMGEERISRTSLGFYTGHQWCQVFAGGEMIYQRMEKGDLWGDTPGCIWNFVAIPSHVDKVTVKIMAAYEDIEEHVVTFYQGDESEMVQTVIKRSLPMAIISGLIVLIGLIAVIVWIVMQRKASIGRSLLYLGIVAVVLGGWCYNETDFAILTISTRMCASFMAYMLLLVLAPAFLLFLKEFLKIGSQKMWRALTIMTMMEYVLILGMHFLNIRDARENLFMIHIVLGVGVLSVIVCLVKSVILKEVDRRIKMSIWGFGILTSAALLDISTYYTNLGNMFYFTGLAFLVFIILMGWESISSAWHMIQKGAEAEEYEKLAMMDALTGLYNRNSYEKDTKRLSNPEDMMIVTFDMNDLKRCNDLLGHRYGDRYIVDVAQTIEAAFEAYGKCYRIGGDEFCCIIERASRCPVDKLIERVDGRNWLYKNGDRSFVGGVACGYSLYKPFLDLNMEETRERADEMMYQRKNEMKEMQKRA